LISSSGPVLELPAAISHGKAEPDTDTPRVLSRSIVDLRLVEREHILSTLEDADWKVSGPSGAAARLGIPQYAALEDEETIYRPAVRSALLIHRRSRIRDLTYSTR
jgi:hypothetical protein